MTFLEQSWVHVAGSHSGVKLCRWTKSMLRGRGGCYKHAFYGIESHRCMEATPSLACANKCVFCWRHHTNPGAPHRRFSFSALTPLQHSFLHLRRSMVRRFLVATVQCGICSCIWPQTTCSVQVCVPGALQCCDVVKGQRTYAVGREWRWKMDAPGEIVEGALSHHVRMINEFKGVPGVKPDRLAEGLQVPAPNACSGRLQGLHPCTSSTCTVSGRGSSVHLHSRTGAWEKPHAFHLM